MTDDVDAYFANAQAIPALSFLMIGTTHEGTIVSKEMAQMRDIRSNAPLHWDNGDPKMQAVITLQMPPDQTVEDDDGLRKLYCGSYGVKLAIAKAIKDAGANGLTVGGTIKIRYTGNGTPTTKGFNPPKQYVARYTPPAAQVETNVDDFFADEPAPEAQTPGSEHYEYPQDEEPF